MEIKKGKFYYNKGAEKLFISDQDMIGDTYITDKIAVHTPTQEDWDYVCEKLGYSEDDWKTGSWCSYGADTCIELYEQMYGNYEWHETNDHHIITIQQFKYLFEPQSKVLQLQKHYDNTHGSLYLIAQQRGWNAYQFDIIKRIDRALKKGNFVEDLKKTKDLIDLWLKESGG